MQPIHSILVAISCLFHAISICQKGPVVWFQIAPKPCLGDKLVVCPFQVPKDFSPQSVGFFLPNTDTGTLPQQISPPSLGWNTNEQLSKALTFSTGFLPPEPLMGFDSMIYLSLPYLEQDFNKVVTTGNNIRVFWERKWQEKLRAIAWKAINVCKGEKGYLMPEELIL